MDRRSHVRNGGQLSLSRVVVLAVIPFVVLAAALSIFLWQSGDQSSAPEKDVVEVVPLQEPVVGEDLSPEEPAPVAEDLPPWTPPPIRLDALVVDTDGKPVLGAQVWAIRSDPNPTRVRDQKDDEKVPLEEVRTDEGAGTGTYSTTQCTDGMWRVVARAAGFATSSKLVGGLVKSKQVTIELGVGQALAGRVFSPDGEGVAGASIVLLHVSEVRNARSDDEGRFEIKHMATGAHTIVVTSARYAPRQIHVIVPGNEYLEIFLEQAATIVGRVVYSEDGEPLENAFIYTPRGTARSNAEGDFQVDGLPSGHIGIVVDHQYAAPHRVPSNQVRLVEGQVFDLGDIELEPGVDAKFSVTRWDGKDPAGLEIRLYADNQTMNAYPPGREYRSGVVDSDGRLLVEGLIPGAYMITVSDPELGGVDPQSVLIPEGADAVAGIALELVGRSNLEGVVHDEGGEPVADAIVKLLINPLNVLPPDFDEREFRTGDDGRFAFRKLRAEEHLVGVVAEGYLSLDSIKLWPQADDEEAHRLKLYRVYTARGRVLGPDGEGITGATVFFDLGLSRSVRSRSGPVGSAKTKEDGTFEAEPFVLGDYDVRVTATGYVDFKSTFVLDGEGPFELEPFVLSRGYELIGRVVDAGGDPRTGIRVITDEYDEGVETSDDGSFTLHFEASGVVDVDVFQGTVHRRVHAVEVPGDIGDVVLEGGVVSGRVITSDGTAIQKFVVEARWEHRPRQLPTAQLSFESAAGEFSMTVSSGDIELVARAGGFAESAPRSLRVEPGGSLDDVDLTLRSYQQIRGEVVRATSGERVSLARVFLRSVDPSKGTSFMISEASDGEFVFERLTAGSYVVWAGGARKNVEVIEGVAPELVRIEVPEAGAIEGRVTRNGVPVEGVHVGPAISRLQNPNGAMTQSATSDTHGVFRLEDLTPGTYPLESRVAGLVHPGPTVNVASGQTTEVDIELPDTVRVEGVVRSTSGEPLAIDLLLHTDGDQGGGFLRTVSGMDGAYSAASVPVGTVVITLPGFGETRRTLDVIEIDGTVDPVQRDITLATGELRMRFLTSEKSTPVSGAAVRLWSDQASERAHATSRSDAVGWVHLEYVGPGTYLCAALHRDHALTLQTIEVGDGEAEELKIFAMDQASSVEIHCVTPDGNPAEGVRVSVVGEQGLDIVPIIAHFADKPDITTGPKGILRLRNMARGNYTVRGSRGGESGELSIEVGDEPQVVELIVASE